MVHSEKTSPRLHRSDGEDPARSLLVVVTVAISQSVITRYKTSVLGVT